jgi:ATP-binding cassette, subfamily C, bacterial CydD
VSAPIDPRLWRESAPMRRYLVSATAFGVAAAAGTVASAVLLGGIVARVITDPGARSLEANLSALGLLAGVWALRVLIHWRRGRVAQVAASEVIADLGARVLAATCALPPRELVRRRDEAATVLTRGLDGLRVYFTGYLPALFLAAILTPATLLVLAVVDGESAVIVLCALPLVPLFMVLIGVATRDRSRAALAAMGTLQSRMLDLLAGLPTLAAFGRAHGVSDRLTGLHAAHRRSAMATMRIAFLSALALEVLATLGVALVAVAVGMRLVYGQLPLQPGLTALLLAPEVFWPLRRVGAAFHAAQDGQTAVAAAFALIDRDTAAPTGHLDLPPGPVTIETAHPLLVAHPGFVTVLTGPNGVGKSTLLQQILALDAPTGVRANGVEVAELDPAQWWATVAWLPQRPVLVPGTVAENLELFGPLTDTARACRDACFDDVLAELPDGLQTAIGRDGSGLSLGQRQRLGLARALGSGRPVLLLDEPTAHLDGPTEARVLAAVRNRAAAGATVVVVGHREPVLAIADTVVEMGATRVPA